MEVLLPGEVPHREVERRELLRAGFLQPASRLLQLPVSHLDANFRHAVLRVAFVLELSIVVFGLDRDA